MEERSSSHIKSTELANAADAQHSPRPEYHQSEKHLEVSDKLCFNALTIRALVKAHAASVEVMFSVFSQFYLKIVVSKGIMLLT